MPVRTSARLMVALLLVAGCKTTPTSLKPGQMVTLRGQLVAGPECPMIASSNGHRYSLGGDLGRFRVGDRVCLKGSVAEASICMAGDATISVTAIGPENACP